ncbi:nucleoside-diphosphate sugar epimerase/dehydratase [Sporomusa termitida]|nr:hypothetical protein [Sporomusa termitida]
MASDKYFESFVTLKRWMENRNAGKNLASYFVDHHYKTVGIYGAGDLGSLLYAELKGSNIKVKYFVDRNSEGLLQVAGVPVIALNDIPKHAHIDVLIVTPIGNFDEICRDLIQIVPELSVISLKDAVYEV